MTMVYPKNSITVGHMVQINNDLSSSNDFLSENHELSRHRATNWRRLVDAMVKLKPCNVVYTLQLRKMNDVIDYTGKKVCNIFYPTT